ncbi:MAG: bifunctional (p)ppGpp synthetase/guanosine-3',5'-bis(diphosphate) 3'-pyrophosphohydrolase [Chitinophagaceae bacterium]
MTTIATYNLNEEEEKKLILREYRGLMRSLKLRLKKGDKKLVRRAFELAVDAHKHMRRKSGEPYILHPIAVAKITVEEIGLGVTSVICALLHDTVEDTEVTLNEIEMEFGTSCSKIVDGLTKISSVVESANSTAQAENFKKILLTLGEDPRVILIKLADRLHNMRTLESMRREKQMKISSETTYIYAPLAHRLGLYEIKSELEDLSMRYMETDIYNEINTKLTNTKRERTRYINEFIKPIKKVLEFQGFKFEIYGRPKSISSIWNKIKTKNVSFEDVYDLFAIRIILDTDDEKADCWRVFSLITNEYHHSTERLRDWISNPKSNGYEALHTTVMGPGGRWVEVQIRSKRMNEIAEKGLAAHWRYKDGSTNESKLDEWLKHIREILQNSDDNAIDFFKVLKKDLIPDEIYVYTPKGDLKVLPKGSTALDFAFDVHSELGKNCIGAKVNYKLVSLNHELKNADQIEIITSKKQKPTEDWLNFVVTAKARSRIKYYLKEEKRLIALEGKEILSRKLNHLKVTVNNANIHEIANYYKYPSPTDLMYDIAINKFDLKKLNNFSVVKNNIVAPTTSIESTPYIFDDKQDELNKKINSKDFELVLFGDSTDKIDYKIANCCKPLPGDDVFGFITSSEGLKVHRTSCPNAASLLANYGHRVIKARWAKNSSVSFLTGILINGLDDVGVINKITNIISGDLKINMRSISIDSKDGIFEGTIMVYVNHKNDLDQLCQQLEALNGINKVTRLEQQ